jgi:hypothetical protein
MTSKLEHTWKLGDGNAKLATPSNQLVVIIIIITNYPLWQHSHVFYQAFFVQKIRLG